MKSTTDTTHPAAVGDEVLREVWRIKDALSASYGHDVARLFAITRQHEQEGRTPRCLNENLQPVTDENAAT